MPTLPLAPGVPRPLWRALRVLAPAFLRLRGWRVEGRPPDAPRVIVVAAPHTSNWDYLYMLAAALVWDVPFTFFAKHTLFREPLGSVLRALGGVPVNRSRLNGLASWAVEQLEQRERFFLVIPPEATRRRADHWNSGFYWIAAAARVPIVLGYADYARRVVGVGPTLVPAGDVEADMATIREFYRGVTARYPDQVGPVELPARSRAPRAILRGSDRRTGEG
jgi:1-acyl-sn-glycerol-3-phosphate acyltransferase